MFNVYNIIEVYKYIDVYKTIKPSRKFVYGFINLHGIFLMIRRFIMVCMLITVNKKYVSNIVNPWLLKGILINILDDIFPYVYV